MPDLGLSPPACYAAGMTQKSRSRARFDVVDDHAVRAIDDPVKLARAARIMRLALERGHEAKEGRS